LKDKFNLPVLKESLDLNPNLISILHDVRRLQKLNNIRCILWVQLSGQQQCISRIYMKRTEMNNSVFQT